MLAHPGVKITLKMSQGSANFDDLLEMALHLNTHIEFSFREVECNNGFARQFFDLQQNGHTEIFTSKNQVQFRIIEQSLLAQE